VPTEALAVFGDSMKYDSRFEQRIAPQLEALGFVRCNDHFRQDGDVRQFHDKEGARFSAKPDWHHPKLGLYIETKAGTLNSKTTVRTAANAEAHRRDHCRIQGKAFNVGDMYATQWSHSRSKQAIVQRDLTPQNFVVVFDKAPSWAEAWDCWNAGIVFVPLADLRQFVAARQLQRLGIGASFSLRYNVEGQEVSFVI